MFQLALEPSETAMVTLLSSTSSFFTLILAAAFPSSSGDRFTLSKFFAVILSIAGTVRKKRHLAEEHFIHVYHPFFILGDGLAE
jgi:hypothetical protein